MIAACRCYTASTIDPDDLPSVQPRYALARHVLGNREHTERHETNRPPGRRDERARFVIDVDSVEFWGTTLCELGHEKEREGRVGSRVDGEQGARGLRSAPTLLVPRGSGPPSLEARGAATDT